MERGQARDSIRRLLGEAAQISPSIAQAAKKGRAGALSDEGVDRRRAERWIQESTNLFRVFNRVYGGPFVELFHQQADDTTRDDARNFSTRIDSIRQRLESVLPLLGPSVTGDPSEAGAPVPGAAPVAGRQAPQPAGRPGAGASRVPGWAWAIMALLIAATVFALVKLGGGR